ncbi:MAG: hypothetical protein KF830_08930 [Planctomycetes bacterium]|nr:hypothetical protein [Planctomycetota bacterium]
MKIIRDGSALLPSAAHDMTSRRLILGILALAIATAAAWFFLGRHVPPPGTSSTSSQVSGPQAQQAEASIGLSKPLGEGRNDGQVVRDAATGLVPVAGRVLAKECAIPLHAIVRDGQGTSVWTDPDTGEFLISTRASSITAWASGYKEASHALTTSDAETITLESLSPSRLQVVDNLGAPVPGADIVHLRRSRGESRFREVLLGQSKDDGSFDFPTGSRAALLFARKEHSISQPQYCDGQYGTIVCDPMTTTHVSVVDASNNAVDCLLDLSMLDILPGVTWGIRCSRQHGALLPAGAYAVSLPGHGKLKGLPPALACNGQVLLAAGGQSSTIHVAEQVKCNIFLRDTVSRKLLDGTASVEILEASGWQGIGVTVQSDPEGGIDIGKLAAITATVSSDYKRIRFSASGFADSCASPYGLSDKSFVDMLPRQSSITLKITRDGSPYGYDVAVRSALDGSDDGPILYKGPVPGAGVSLPCQHAAHLIICDARGFIGRELARESISAADSSGTIHVELPRSAEILVVGGMPEADVCALGQNGELFRGQYRADAVLISGLFPGP